MDQDLKAYLEEREARMEARMDERFSRLEARLDERFEQVDKRFEQVETEARHTRVLMEGMHGNIRLLAEGVIGTDERLEAFQRQNDLKLEEIKSSVDQTHRHLVPRLKLLEEKAARENRDVLEVIRERFGPSPPTL